jgi:TatD-related deoxyribonuclease
MSDGYANRSMNSMKLNPVITDNHMHLDRKGVYLEAVKQFQRAGGTRIILVQKPSFPTSLDQFTAYVEDTLATCREVREYVDCHAVIGLHPAEFDRLYNSGKKELCYEILHAIKPYIQEKRAVAMGEFGTPHYPVSRDTYREAHQFMIEALHVSRECDCPIQLHTESLDEHGIRVLDELVREIGCKKVIKHFSSPTISTYEIMIPSVLATESNITEALSTGRPFLMETDYIDDPQRPGAVLGPKTVPRTTCRLLKNGILSMERAHHIHQEMIESLYSLE